MTGSAQAHEGVDTKISTKGTIEEYVNGTDWRIQANSNTGYSHAGLINQFGLIKYTLSMKDKPTDKVIYIFMT